MPRKPDAETEEDDFVMKYPRSVVGDDEAPQSPLTPKELAYIRELIKRDEHAKWAAATIRVWAAWIGAVLIAGSLLYDNLKRALKAMIGS